MDEVGKEKLSFNFKKIGIVIGAIVIVLIVVLVFSSGIKEVKKKQPSISSDPTAENIIPENLNADNIATEEGKVDIEFESLALDMEANHITRLLRGDVGLSETFKLKKRFEEIGPQRRKLNELLHETGA